MLGTPAFGSGAFSVVGRSTQLWQPSFGLVSARCLFLGRRSLSLVFGSAAARFSSCSSSSDRARNRSPASTKANRFFRRLRAFRSRLKKSFGGTGSWSKSAACHLMIFSQWFDGCCPSIVERGSSDSISETDAYAESSDPMCEFLAFSERVGLQFRCVLEVFLVSASSSHTDVVIAVPDVHCF